MTGILINIQVDVSWLPEDTQRMVISKFTQQQKLDLFEALKRTQYLLPRTNTFYKVFQLVEYPDGWQIELNDYSNGSHKVSHEAYETRNDAHNAMELGLVEWNELNESPLAVATRVEIEDLSLID